MRNLFSVLSGLCAWLSILAPSAALLSACGGRTTSAGNSGAGSGLASSNTSSGSPQGSGNTPSGTYVDTGSGVAIAGSSAGLSQSGAIVASGSDAGSMLSGSASTSGSSSSGDAPVRPICVLLASDYDQSCAVDGDCAGVSPGDYCTATHGCNCGPPSAGINVKAVAQFNADLAKTPAGPPLVCPCPFIPADPSRGPCCRNGMCQVGVCAPASPSCDPMSGPRCNGNSIEVCDATGKWNPALTPCGPTRICVSGLCTEPPSCGFAADGGLGTDVCGNAGNSCCLSPIVPGGIYDRAESSLGNGFKPVSTTVSPLRLDLYDVTVGRFRRFVNAVLPTDGGAGWLPADGAGKHGHLNGGKGLAVAGAAGATGGYEAGWVSADAGNISPTDANLQCGKAATWTPTAAGNEGLPINCANWYEAYAFCIWDGGFLPSQAEWEYAAVGGSQERIYPWGSTAPGTSNRYAIYGCLYPSMSGMCNGAASIAPVGTAVAGAGLWGQLDLTGNVIQWNLDGIPYYFVPCADCFSPGFDFQVTSGGSFSGPASTLSVLQGGGGPFPTLPTDPKNTRADVFGFRCARTP